MILLINYKSKVSPKNTNSEDVLDRQVWPEYIPHYEEDEIEENPESDKLVQWIKRRVIFEKSLEWQVENRKNDCWAINGYERDIQQIIERGLLIENELEEEVAAYENGYLIRSSQGVNEDYSPVICKSIKYN